MKITDSLSRWHLSSIAADPSTKPTDLRLLWRDEEAGLYSLSAVLGGDDQLVVRFRDLVDFVIDTSSRQVRFKAESKFDTDEISAIWLEFLLPRLLAYDCRLVLHAGAIADDAGSVLFVGNTGRGKSTLVTSFRQAGWQVLTDDAVDLELDEKVVTAHAVSRSIRLLPDSWSRLFGMDAPEGAPPNRFRPKHRLDLEDPDKPSGSSPLRAIFEIGPPSAREVAVERIRPSEACMAIVSNSFALNPADERSARTRLQQASEVAVQVPVYRTSYPRDYTRLPEVREAIENTLRKD